MLVSSDIVRDKKVEVVELFLTKLKENNNNITSTAKLIGISRSRARKIARNHGIVPSPKWISNIGRRSNPPAAAVAFARDAEILDKLPELMRQHGSKAKIAKALGVGERAVLRVMRANNIAMPPRVQAGVPKGPRSKPTSPRPIHVRDAEILAQLPQLLAEHKFIRSVALVLKTSHRTVSRLMKTHNIPLPEPDDKYTDLRQKLPALLAQHGTITAVAAVVKITPKTISHIMRKHGITPPGGVRTAAVVPRRETAANPDRYANLRDRLPQLFAEHKSQAAVAKAVGVDKKTIARALKATGYKPPQVMPGPQAKSKQKGSTPFNGGRVFRFMSSDGGEPVTVEFCADPKMEKARERLLQNGSQNDDAVWEVHQAYGVPLRDVYRLRYENRERAKGRM